MNCPVMRLGIVRELLIAISSLVPGGALDLVEVNVHRTQEK